MKIPKKKPRKKRKSSNQSKGKQSVPVSKVASSSRTIRIRSSKFAYLKKNPDFVALVKVGRVVNTVSFGIKCIDDYMNDTSPVGRRQTNRAMLVTGGYLFEGLALAGSLQSKYVKEPFFKGLNDLIGPDYKPQYKMLQELRHSVGFHLDSTDKTTKTTIESMSLKRHDLASGEDDTMLGFYFDFADAVDFNYLIDKFNKGEEELETFRYIVQSLGDMFVKFQRAGHEFLVGLGEKLEISEFVD